ncbi:MAG: valine--tRNA ligase [Candidatus Latescibacteria bacterium]|nr:valine--tRNA ligase [Candidatus Latescibacterota bacterium]
MALAKKCDFKTEEERCRAEWEEHGVYRFVADRPVYAIDTPPPTVSGKLHMGHVYSYCQTDFVARFQRMRGCAVFYPMGFDDNGLPTEQLVERQLGQRAEAMDAEQFRARCLAVSREAAAEYRALWRDLGLSVDWQQSYRTIEATRLAQWAFLDLYQKDLVYRREAPVIWCPACATAIAQADLEEVEREGTMHTLAFALEDGGVLPIATTRPELLPACAAVFVHPDDGRWAHLVGRRVRLPLEDRWVEVRADVGADPDKGTGAVMCCTFGDTADVEWWRLHDLPLREIIDARGRLQQGPGAGCEVEAARSLMVEALAAAGKLLDKQAATQGVRVHERCDTPVEYLVAPQWFVRVLDFKDDLLDMGEQLEWRPAHMANRYRQWVEGLAWDWCISRQRYFGVPFPLWYCGGCGAEKVAEMAALPVDPQASPPSGPCACGVEDWQGEKDVMDTWATSSLTPQIAGGFEADPELYERVFPFAVRPLAHEIIRTWAFYTLVRARHHFGRLPWKTVAVSGWGLAPEGGGKISKSRGGGPVAPAQMLARYPADALRYWAASTGLGRDALISQDKIKAGARLLTKLWNVARFCEPFLTATKPDKRPALSPADAWILARMQEVIERATQALEAYDHAAAKSTVERFFWGDLADNYLEMAKKRLYDSSGQLHQGACWTLAYCLQNTVKLLAPFLPYTTEAIYRGLFAGPEGGSVHRACWPEVEDDLHSADALRLGVALVAVGTAVRGCKSAANKSLGTPLASLQIAVSGAQVRAQMPAAAADIASITRARQVIVSEKLDDGLPVVEVEGGIRLALDWGPQAEV